MTSNYMKLAEAEPIRKFAALAKQSGTAIMDGEVGLANRSLVRMWVIEDVLRARGRPARLALVPLLSDQDRMVRYYAAQHLLGIVPERARPVIEENAKFWFDPIAADARGTLRMIDSGEYKPD